MKKHKKAIITAAGILAVLCCIRMGAYFFTAFNFPGRLLGVIPSLAAIEEQGGAFAHEKINGCKREQLIGAWGDPTDMSNQSGDICIWRIDDNTYLRVTFNGLDEVASAALVRDGRSVP